LGEAIAVCSSPRNIQCKDVIVAEGFGGGPRDGAESGAQFARAGRSPLLSF